MKQADFLKIPDEVVGQLDTVEETLATCKLLDMQKLASTSGADGERFDAHLDAAQLYVDVSRYVQGLARVICLCEGKAESSLTGSVLSKPQERIDKARARYERHERAKKETLTLGIEHANKVISAVNKSKRKASAQVPVKVDTKKQGATKKREGHAGMEKHQTMQFLDDLKKPV